MAYDPSRPYRLRLVPFNAADDAAISGPSASADTSPANLQIASRSDIWRATGTGATLTLTWAASREIGCVALLRSNFSATAKWRVRCYLGAAVVHDSGESEIAPPKTLGELDWGFDPLGACAFAPGIDPFGVYWLPESVAADKLVVTLADSAAAYFQAARLVAGAVWTPDYNLSRGYQLTFSDLSKQTRAADGSLRTDAGARLRKLSLQLANLTERDRAQLVEIVATNGTRRDFLISVSPSVGGRKTSDYTMLGKFTREVVAAQAGHERYGAPLDIEES